MRSTILSSFLSLSGILHLAHGDANAAYKQSGAQYILYSGNISTSLTFDPKISSSAGCKSGPKPSVGGTSLYIGKNPPWDPNPFFFELYHLASDTRIGLTNDDVYNLDFSSAASECYKDGKPCGFIAVNFDLVPQTYLDLKKTKIAKTTVNGEEGYSVIGDTTSWVSTNGTGNGVDVVSGCREVSWQDWIWNSTFPPSYNLTFTNSSASLSLTTMQGSSSMTLAFSAPRNTTTTPKTPPTIQLNLASPDTPAFNYANGSEIFFAQKGSSWVAAASQIATGSSGASPTKGGSTGVGGSAASPTSTNGVVALADNVKGVKEVWIVMVGVVGLMAVV